MSSQAARLSKILFEARERIDMSIDVVEIRLGQVDRQGRAIRDEIDVYRAEQGWSPDGFGGEQDDPVRRLYGRQRDVLDNLAQTLTDWHGVISKVQFLDAFDGGNEDLIPDAFADEQDDEA